MAYLTLIASVPLHQINAIRADEKTVLSPLKVNGVSHLLAYCVQIQPLGKLLARTIDGGELLHRKFWHPLRPPMYHEPADVESLASELTLEWEAVRSANAIDDDWLEFEMNRLLAVIGNAYDNANAIVTALDLPGDNDRAQRVRIPWLPHTGMHGAKPRRWWLPWL